MKTLPKTKARKPTRRIEFFRDRRREWRWRAISHGRVLAVASEGYKRRIDAAIAARVTAFCLTGPQGFVRTPNQDHERKNPSAGETPAGVV